MSLNWTSHIKSSCECCSFCELCLGFSIGIWWVPTNFITVTFRPDLMTSCLIRGPTFKKSRFNRGTLSMAFVMSLGRCTKRILTKFLQNRTSYFSIENNKHGLFKLSVNISCFWQLCVVLCYLEFSVKIGVPVERFPCSEVASELSASNR